jgi:hypothetical protein
MSGEMVGRSWTQRLQDARDHALAQSSDPWRIRLERVRGKIFDDGIERIATQAVFDFLEVPQRNRTAPACRRLRNLMTEGGWVPIKARGLNQAGFRDQIRGYARERSPSPLS